eukprot:m.100018 g.100018  ORF g.100018 m.100018 type:complete len:177 (-) comp15372_c0_seq3:506-1036(-)
METLIELRHGIISPDFGKSAPNLGHHQTRHNHQPSRDMAKPLPDGVEFAGHATWPQNAGSQTNQEMDRLMNEAAAKAFPGSRAATGREYQKKLVLVLWGWLVDCVSPAAAAAATVACIRTNNTNKRKPTIRFCRKTTKSSSRRSSSKQQQHRPPLKQCNRASSATCAWWSCACVSY